MRFYSLAETTSSTAKRWRLLCERAALLIGMIGSRRKVQLVFTALREAGTTDEQLAAVYAPIGLDLGADAPAEIAISVLAEVLMVLRHRSGKSLRAG